jgi:hypothetical protein
MSSRFRFEHSFIDPRGLYDGWGAVAVADFDGDGRPEFATGGKGGGFYSLYDFEPDSATWIGHVITRAFSPQVGAAATDLDGDGRPELVSGEWGGRLFHLVSPGPGQLDDWQCHVVGEGLKDPHDVLAADIDGDGRDEILVREKDGPLHLFRAGRDPAAEAWHHRILVPHLPGDGTLAIKMTGRGQGLDIVTNAGWFENVSGDGSRWVRHPLVAESLAWHPESRLASGDVDGDGRNEIVIAESEIAGARLGVLRQAGQDRAWEMEILLPAQMDLRALHSLQLADLDDDGRLEIFTAEMENRKTDGLKARPKWWCLAREADGSWSRHILLDSNLGTHAAVVGDFDGDGRPDIVGKTWRANAINGNGGRGHVDFLRNLGALSLT